MTFANVGRNIVYLNQFSDKSDLIDAIRDVPYENGNTKTSGGLRVMHFEQFTRANGDRADAPNIAIVMTDGESTWDSDRTIPDAEAARIAGIQIYSIGITESIDEQEARKIFFNKFMFFFFGKVVITFFFWLYQTFHYIKFLYGSII